MGEETRERVRDATDIVQLIGERVALRAGGRPFAAFTQASQFTFGNLSRTIGYRGPGQKNWDISMFKSFPIKERLSLQFRAEFFNAFNQVRFNPPNLDSSSPFFGQIQGAQPPRILQFSLRLQF